MRHFNTVPPLLRDIDELQDMHLILTHEVLQSDQCIEIVLARSRLTPSVQKELRGYLKVLEGQSSYISDYVEFENRVEIRLIDLAAFVTEYVAQC